jgi:hypothetical protein
MCLDPDDCDRPSVYSETWHKARKPHKCSECYAPIPVGVRYLNVFGVWDGDAETFRVHAECDELRTVVENQVCGGHGFVPLGYLAQEIVDAYGEYGSADADLEQLVRDCAEAMEGVRRMYRGEFVTAPLFSDDALSKD